MGGMSALNPHAPYHYTTLSVPFRAGDNPDVCEHSASKPFDPSNTSPDSVSSSGGQNLTVEGGCFMHVSFVDCLITTRRINIWGDMQTPQPGIKTRTIMSE